MFVSTCEQIDPPSPNSYTCSVYILVDSVLESDLYLYTFKMFPSLSDESLLGVKKKALNVLSGSHKISVESKFILYRDICCSVENIGLDTRGQVF